MICCQKGLSFFIKTCTLREALDVVMHIFMVHASIVLHQRELVAHAQNSAAKFTMYHFEVLAPEVLELLQDRRR